MTRRPTPAQRLWEALAWVAVAAAGVLVLLPAAVELVRARDLEERTAATAERAEARARDANQQLIWFESDPWAREKLLEAHGLLDRMPEEDE